MEAKVYIEDGFFTAFDNFQLESSIGEPDVKSENRNQLIKIFQHSEINAPLAKKVVIQLHKKLSQNYKPSTVKESIYYRAFRNNKLKLNTINLEDSGSIFLLDKQNVEVERIILEKNVFSKGANYDFKTSISPKTFACCPVDKRMNGIERLNHRCRNVVIIDPYLFCDQHNFEPKIPNLLILLKELYLDNANTDCNLSIITNSEDNNAKFERKINEIKAGLDNVNLKISVYGHREGLFNNNRHFITDYSIIDVQHLLDRDNASISVNYLYDGDVESNFKRVKILIDKIILNYRRDPAQMGLFKRKFGNLLENNLLK